MTFQIPIDPILGAPVGSRWREWRGSVYIIKSAATAEKRQATGGPYNGSVHLAWFANARVSAVDEAAHLADISPAQRLTANRLVWACRARGAFDVRVEAVGSSVYVETQHRRRFIGPNGDVARSTMGAGTFCDVIDSLCGATVTAVAADDPPGPMKFPAHPPGEIRAMVQRQLAIEKTEQACQALIDRLRVAAKCRGVSVDNVIITPDLHYKAWAFGCGEPITTDDVDAALDRAYPALVWPPRPCTTCGGVVQQKGRSRCDACNDDTSIEACVERAYIRAKYGDPHHEHGMTSVIARGGR